MGASSNDVRRLTTLALLMAASVVLTRFFGVMAPIAGVMVLRLSFGEIPIMLAGATYGPAAGAVVGAMADLLGMALFPSGVYFPGFTLSSALTGFIPGIMLRWGREREDGRPERVSYWWLLAIVATTNAVVSVGLNTVWLAIMYDKAIAVLLPARLAARVVMAPLQAAVLGMIIRRNEMPATRSSRTAPSRW